jgi:TolB-like protein/Flp pilus assembly protein TadD
MASVWAELKRRNVIRVAVAYAVVAWLLIEISATLFPMLRLPEWTATFVAALLIIGFPVALILAWAFELTPEGLKKEKEVDRSESITHSTGRKLDFAIIGVLAVAVAYFVSEKFFWADDDDIVSAIVSAPQIESLSTSTEAIANTVAVLPFVNMSGDADQEYFSDGITEEILNALAGIRELAVTSRTSAFAFKGKSVSIPEIAQQLGVAHVLEGSVRKSGTRLRITAQLIDVASDKHLWSETYDRELTDIFAVQDEISANIAAALKVNLLGDTAARPAARAVIPDAYDAYLHGLQQMAFNTYASLAQAEDYFKQAITIDRAFVRAYAGLGWAFVSQIWQGSVSRDINRPKIREILRRGLELDPDNAGLVALSGHLAFLDEDLEQARLLFRQATSLEPPYFGAWIGYADTLFMLGRVAEAMQVQMDSREVDPLNPETNLKIAFYQQFTGRYDDVIATTSRLKAIAPDNPYGSFIEALTRILYLGELADGILEFENGLKIDPNDHEALCIMAITYFSLGEMASGEAWVDRARQDAPEATFVKAAEAYSLALRGELESARRVSLDALANHRQFDRWWGGFMTMRFAIDELIDRGETNRAIDMILEADPGWRRFIEQSPAEAPQLSSHPGLYRTTAWIIDYMPDVVRALRAAGDDSGADNVLAHAETLQEWQREHGVVASETGAAELHALRGRSDDALDALERAEADGMIYAYWQYRLIHNRIFDDIRDHPRYTALIDRVEAEMQRQWTEYRKNRAPSNQIPL